MSYCKACPKRGLFSSMNTLKDVNKVRRGIERNERIPRHCDDGGEFNFDGNVTAFAFTYTVLSHAVISSTVVFRDAGNRQNVATVLRSTGG